MKNLQDELIKQLGIELSQLGFLTKASDQAFIRKFPGIRQSYHLAFIRHAADFDITADVAIRFDAVEDLLNKDSLYLSKKAKMNTYTLGCELGNMAEGQQHRWSITTASDVEHVAEDMFNYFQRFGLPYIEKYSELLTAFELIARTPEIPCLHTPFLEYRAKIALIMATLLARTGDLPSLVKRFEAALSSTYPHGLPGFRSFVQKNVIYT